MPPLSGVYCVSPGSDSTAPPVAVRFAPSMAVAPDTVTAAAAPDAVSFAPTAIVSPAVSWADPERVSPPESIASLAVVVRPGTTNDKSSTPVWGGFVAGSAYTRVPETGTNAVGRADVTWRPPPRVLNTTPLSRNWSVTAVPTGNSSKVTSWSPLSGLV